MRVRLKTPGTSRAGERTLQLAALEGHRFRGWRDGPCTAFTHDAGKGRWGKRMPRHFAQKSMASSLSSSACAIGVLQRGQCGASA